MAAGLLALSGCSGFAADGDSLLHPPRPTGDKAAIQDIISREAGGTYNLKYPQKGVNRSAIILRNENTDNEYALALYSTENDSKLNVSIISYANEQWKCLGTYTNNSSGVDRVLFCDINADKREEIVIGWTSYNSAHKSLTAYSFDKDEVYEMSIDETYDDLAIVDMTNDATDDILLLSLSTQDTPSAATLLQYSDPDKRPVGKYSLELDSEVIAFSNIIVGDVAINTEIKPSEIKLTASGARSDTSGTESADESSAEGDASKDESADESDASKDESAAEGDASKDESADEGDASKDESAAEGDASKDESAAEGDASKDESAAEGDASKDESADEGDDPEVSMTSDDASTETHEDAGTVDEQSAEESGTERKNITKKFDANAILSKKGVVIDCKRSDNTFCTQMVYYDNLSDELIDPIVKRSEGGAYVNPTMRTEAIFSRDINGDEIIEVPVSAPMNASTDDNGAYVCNLTVWCNYNARERKSNVALNTVMNMKDGYYFVMPDRWLNTVTARSDAETREMTFYLWNSKTSSLGDKLLLISRYNEQQWKETDHSGRILLDIYSEKSNAVYAAVIYLTSADEKLNITEKELQEAVLLI